MSKDGSEGWVALHVFYASDANPIITETIRPLVQELRADALIDGWFFIKYWMEGPHLRLRLHLTKPDVREEVMQRASTALKTFLKRRPALYDTDIAGLDDVYKKMYLAEYSQERWDSTYGVGGTMPYRPNNSIAWLPYEREYDRYGGPVGMEIAEWHFEYSSDLVARLLTATNTQIRPLLLGLAAQLSLMLGYTFLNGDEEVARFFQRYRSFWETSYQEPSDGYHDSFEKSLALTRHTLTKRVDRVREAAAGRAGALSGVEAEWLGHCRELRDRVMRAATAGELKFPKYEGSETNLSDSPEALSAVLLSSYIHMTNNRLGIAILDEIYLSYLVERSLVTEEQGLPV